MKTVAYFEGTPTDLLSKLNLSGVDTLPVGHMWDNYGRNVEIIGKDEANFLIGWIHKINPVKRVERTAKDILWNAKNLEIPIFILIPEGFDEEAKKVLGDAAEFTTLVTRDNALEKIKEVL